MKIQSVLAPFFAVSLLASTQHLLGSEPDAFEIVQELESRQTGDQKLLVKTKFKGPQLRVEMGDSITLMDARTGDIITLLPSQKQYIKLPGNLTQKLKDFSSNFRDSAPSKSEVQLMPPKLEPTGKTLTISGYTCEEYKGSIDGGKLTLWITKDREAAQAFHVFARNSAATSNDKDPAAALWRPLAGLPEDFGFPVRTEFDAGPASVSITVLSIKKVPLKDSEFVPPSDYKPLDFPAGLEKLFKGQ
jgi:hypothetical protein